MIIDNIMMIELITFVIISTLKYTYYIHDFPLLKLPTTVETQRTVNKVVPNVQ